MATDRRAELSEQLARLLMELSRTTDPQARDALHVMIENLESQLDGGTGSPSGLPE